VVILKGRVVRLGSYRRALLEVVTLGCDPLNPGVRWTQSSVQRTPPGRRMNKWMSGHSNRETSETTMVPIMSEHKSLSLGHYKHFCALKNCRAGVWINKSVSVTVRDSISFGLQRQRLKRQRSRKGTINGNAFLHWRSEIYSVYMQSVHSTIFINDFGEMNILTVDSSDNIHLKLYYYWHQGCIVLIIGVYVNGIITLWYSKTTDYTFLIFILFISLC
jgi:hypothetical protein